MLNSNKTNLEILLNSVNVTRIETPIFYCYLPNTPLIEAALKMKASLFKRMLKVDTKRIYKDIKPCDIN